MTLATFYEQFELLADAPNAVQKLREMVLQLAVRGKLIEQNDNESSLLEVIQQAQKTGAKRKRKDVNSLSLGSCPFPVPANWAWVEVGHLGETQTGTTSPKGNYESFGNDYPFVRPADILPDQVVYREELSTQGVEKHGRLARAGSVLMVCIGTIGKCNKSSAK